MGTQVFLSRGSLSIISRSVRSLYTISTAEQGPYTNTDTLQSADTGLQMQDSVCRLELQDFVCKLDVQDSVCRLDVQDSVCRTQSAGWMCRTVCELLWLWCDTCTYLTHHSSRILAIDLCALDTNDKHACCVVWTRMVQATWRGGGGGVRVKVVSCFGI